MIKEAIIKAAAREDLDRETAAAVMDEIMSGSADDIMISAFLTAMHMKGETVEEITAFAAGMRKYCRKLSHNSEVLEIVGTGGDGANTFNISTTSAIVVASCGIPVAKHGNRAATAKCGAADCLEALGVNLTVEPRVSERILKENNLCFMFAQKYHVAMKYVANVRKRIGIPTVFNILGPLSNPADAGMQLLGVYDKALIEPLARVLSNLGVKNGMVVRGQDGIDEISLCAPTDVCEIRDGVLKSYTVTPEQFGFERCQRSDLTGGDPKVNAEITRAILAGERGPRRDVVVLNSAAAIYVAKPDTTLSDCIKTAQDAIDSGKAAATLDRLIAMSNEAEQ